MTSRIAVLATVVAAVAVLIAGVVSFGLVRYATEDEARKSLARQVELASQTTVSERLPPRLSRQFRAQGIEVVRVTPRGEVRGAGPAAAAVVRPYLGRLGAGEEISVVRPIGGETFLIEGRPLPAGGSIVLVQRQRDSQAFARQLVSRLVLALTAGLLIAAAAGWWLARRLARPLRSTATVARRLAGGARGIRAPTVGAPEIADVAIALNTLAAAVETSEGRQREFLLSISHELRTPLTAIKGFAESLADGVVTGKDTPAVGTTLVAEADRLERLITDLLDLARLGAEDFRIDVTEADLTTLVRSAAEVWRARCETEGLMFAVEVPSEPLVVRTDPIRVRQILDGLAENALRVTPAGRPIVLALRDEQAWAVLEVRDGGPGLTPEDRAVAFDRSALYERYRGVRKVGTGVGLALVHGLTLRLGGHAAAGQAPEGGARFTIRLPQAAPASAPEA